MGKLKIEDLKDLKLFKKWFEKIGKKAKSEVSEEEDIRTWANAEIKKKFRDELKELDSNPDPEYGSGQKYEIRPNEENKK